MDNYLLIILFSIVQGITEFVPISSSGHLVLLHSIFPEVTADNFAFDVILHLGSVLAVIVFFWIDLKKIIINWFKSLFCKKFDGSDARLGWFIIIATIPAALAGYFLEDIIKNSLRSSLVVAVMLIVVGLLFLLIEKYAKHQDDLSKLTWKKALLVGVGQALALIPGTSRSGITIIAGMLSNLKREAALRFSFLLSVPIILGANIKGIPPMFIGAIPREDVFGFILGFVIALVVSYFVIKYFMLFVRKYSLNIFAYYRFLLAAAVLLLWLAQ